MTIILQCKTFTLPFVSCKPSTLSSQGSFRTARPGAWILQAGPTTSTKGGRVYRSFSLWFLEFITYFSNCDTNTLYWLFPQDLSEVLRPGDSTPAWGLCHLPCLPCTKSAVCEPEVPCLLSAGTNPQWAKWLIFNRWEVSSCCAPSVLLCWSVLLFTSLVSLSTFRNHSGCMSTKMLEKSHWRGQGSPQRWSAQIYIVILNFQ